MKKYLLVVAMIVTMTGIVLPVLAAEAPQGVAITVDDINSLIEGIAGWIIKIALIVMVISIVAAALKIMTAGSNPKAFQEGVGWLKNAIIGSAIVLGVGVIINTVASVVSLDFFNF